MHYHQEKLFCIVCFLIYQTIKEQYKVKFMRITKLSNSPKIYFTTSPYE